jgi:hypothetical protein
MIRFLRTVRLTGVPSTAMQVMNELVPRYVERIRSWPGVAGCTVSVGMSGPTAMLYWQTTCPDMASLEKALAAAATDEEFAALDRASDKVADWSSMHDVVLRDIA